MKIRFSSRGLVSLGFVVLLVVNLYVLYRVASNRSGKPEALVKLTERELELPLRINKENSGLYLLLDWRVINDSGNFGHFSPVWLNEKKLGELGFSASNKKFNRLETTKEVFIVLENNGEHYRQVIEKAEKELLKEKSLFEEDREDKKLLARKEAAEKHLKYERLNASRLFVIDAGLNPDKLRKKYADRTRYIITRGLVWPSNNAAPGSRKPTGVIGMSNAERIHVPLEHRKVLDAIMAQNKSDIHDQFAPPRYEVELAYGSRFEPWIVSVTSLEINED